MDISSLMNYFWALWENPTFKLVILLIGFFIITKISLWLIGSVVLKFTTKTKTELDDKIVALIQNYLPKIVLAIAAKVSVDTLTIPSPWNFYLINIIATLIIIYITRFALGFIDIIIKEWGAKWAKRTKSHMDDEIVKLVHKTSGVVGWILALFFIFSIWGIDVKGLIAGVGVAGIAIGFAVKDSLANIFGGISLILDKAIKVGDHIEISATESGEVVDIGLRSTRIKNWDNELIIIPNGVLANSQFKNWKLPSKDIRCVIPFGVEYGSDIDKVKKLVLNIIKKYHEFPKDDEKRTASIMFNDMADSALLFSARFWIHDVGKRASTKDKARKEIYDALNKARIGIPFPTSTVYLKKETGKKRK
ncbi:mechanosensitive ion channel family protein [Nanoarchaeota archaeon]